MAQRPFRHWRHGAAGRNTGRHVHTACRGHLHLPFHLSRAQGRVGSQDHGSPGWHQVRGGGLCVWSHRHTKWRVAQSRDDPIADASTGCRHPPAPQPVWRRPVRRRCTRLSSLYPARRRRQITRRCLQGRRGRFFLHSPALSPASSTCWWTRPPRHPVGRGRPFAALWLGAAFRCARVRATPRVDAKSPHALPPIFFSEPCPLESLRLPSGIPFCFQYMRLRYGVPAT
mmetsp:Transcript_1808/g.5949  ORF Transcript_1808/g.5949 Transcript_1808/m.5949 type:complete len:228 (-) Transcript_1808:235-918(-)|eukprot:scaffold28205_cov197-Isochrysis_galbana.AAC.1